MNYEIRRPEGCFLLIKSTYSKTSFEECLGKLKIRDNLDDYVFIKATRNFKIITKQTFLDKKYAGTLILEKTNSKGIEEYLDYLVTFKDLIYITNLNFKEHYKKLNITKYGEYQKG